MTHAAPYRGHGRVPGCLSAAAVGECAGTDSCRDRQRYLLRGALPLRAVHLLRGRLEILHQIDELLLGMHPQLRIDILRAFDGLTIGPLGSIINI